jgi:hypothetical protein
VSNYTYLQVTKAGEDFGELQSFTSVELKGTGTCIRYRPKCDNFTEEWGDLNTDSINPDVDILTYLKLNATTEEGRAGIAKMNGVTTRWDEKVKAHNDQTTVQEKCYDLLCLVVDNGKRPVLCSHIEGLHRAGAMISLTTGRKIDCFTGVLSELLSFEYFLDILDDPSQYDNDDNFKSADPFQRFLHDKLLGTNGSDKCEFVGDYSNVTVRYISAASDKSDINSILDRLRKYSQVISDHKVVSQKKGADRYIGELIFEITSQGKPSSLDNDNYHYDPDLTIPPETVLWEPRKQYKPSQLSKQLAKATKELESNRKKLLDEKLTEREISQSAIEKQAMGLPDITFDSKFENYCSKPFDDNTNKEMKELWTFPVVGHDKMTIKPPFINKFSTLVNNPGPHGTKALNTWIANTCWFLPKIVHILFADKLNKPIKCIEGRNEVKQMCLYAVRYHANAYGLSNVLVDGMSKRNYPNMSYAAHTNSPSVNVIAAALMVCDVINVTLTHPGEFLAHSQQKAVHSQAEINLEIANTKRLMSQCVNETSKAFSSIRVRTSTASTTDILHALGLFHFHFVC